MCYADWIKHLSPLSDQTLAAVVALGHVEMLDPSIEQYLAQEKFDFQFIKKLLEVLSDTCCVDVEVLSIDWCEEHQLPRNTQLVKEMLKMMTRWVCQHLNTQEAQQAFQVMDRIITQGRKLFPNQVMTGAEEAWLRLVAGSCILKMCTFPKLWMVLTSSQFFHLSILMQDGVDQVQEMFVDKLCKNLRWWDKNRILYCDFIAFFAFCGRWTNSHLRTRMGHKLNNIIAYRRLKVTSFTTKHKEFQVVAHFMKSCGRLLVEMSVSAAVALMAHLAPPDLANNVLELQNVKSCLEFLLLPMFGLKNGSPTLLPESYKTLFATLKRRSVATVLSEANMDLVNQRMWLLCEIGEEIVARCLRRNKYGMNTSKHLIHSNKILGPMCQPTGQTYLQPQLQLFGQKQRSRKRRSDPNQTAQPPTREEDGSVPIQKKSQPKKKKLQPKKKSQPKKKRPSHTVPKEQL